MAWYPKAIRKEVKRHRTARLHQGGRVALHVAVSNGSSLFSHFNQNGKPTSHFYVRKDGTIEQYVDTKYRAPANLNGNPSLVSFETQGGVVNANSEPWTAAQVKAMAECIAWLNKVHGIPLKAMPNSKPSSTGIGYHKQGVDPYRVSGGELWSSARGKICPGAGKIKQIPTIIAKAKALVGTPAPVPSKPTPTPTIPNEELDVAAREDILNYQRACTIQIQKNFSQVLNTAVDRLIKNQQELAAWTAANGRQTVGENVDTALADNFAALAGAMSQLATATAQNGALLAQLVELQTPKA